jgi:UDP-2,3-diacylglucosamine pyrophosphatase LpxH
MYLRIASDLHLEGFYGRDLATLAVDFLPHNVRDETSILVLAGDISSKLEQLVGFLNTVADRFIKVLFVPGNHCYYRHDFDEWNRNFKAAELKPNIIFSTDDVVQHEIPGFRFLLTTLWGDGGPTPADRLNTDRGLNDFRLIRQNGTRFSVNEMIVVHKMQKAALETALKEPFDGKTIVVSHHMPSYRLCHPRFGNEINGGFASNCDDILAYDHAPWLWIYGHTHDTIDTQLWKTRLVCNPAGYRSEYSTSFNTFHEVPVFIELSNG